MFAFCSDIIGGMSYIPPIPKAHLETYRAAARAYRAARRLGARQHEWHWAAVREVSGSRAAHDKDVFPIGGGPFDDGLLTLGHDAGRGVIGEREDR